MRLEETLARRRAQLRAVRDDGPFEADERAGRVPAREARLARLASPEDRPAAVLDFARWYLPEFFASPFAPFHRELVEAACRAGRDLSLVAAPPEHGKTALLVAFKLYCAVTGFRRMYAQVGETREVAETNLKLVRQELAENARLAADFGPLLDERYRTADFFAARCALAPKTERQALTAFRAFGYKMSLKGWTFQSRRVDFAELDDFEPASTAPPPRLVAEREAWLFSQVVPRLDRGGAALWLHNNAATGTLADRLHTAAAEDAGREGVFARRYPALSAEDVPLWPERYTAVELDATRRRVGRSAWAGDYQQAPLAQGARFQPEWLGTYTSLPPGMAVLGRLDPSLSAKGDTKALILVGLGPEGAFYVLPGSFCRKASLERMARATFDAYERWRGDGFRGLAIEADFRQDLVYGPAFEAEADRRGYRLPLGTYHSQKRGAKQDRIAWLEPHAEAGLLRLPENWAKDADLAELVHQLLAWDGSGRGHDDGPDALSQAVFDLEPAARSARRGRSGTPTDRLLALMRVRSSAPSRL